MKFTRHVARTLLQRGYVSVSLGETPLVEECDVPS